jgi:hypothetical protein
MVRSANALLAILCIAPVVYIIIATELALGRRGFAGNPGIVPLLFPALVGVSIANIGIMVLLQMRWRPMAGKAQYDPVTRVYLIVSMGAILSEAHSIYGLILTLLSGSIFYVIGFTLVTWVSLLWVRERFKRNLANI